MNKIARLTAILGICLTALLTLSSCNDKKDVVGTWHSDIIGGGRVSFVFDNNGSLKILENGVHEGTSKYKVLPSGDVRVTDLDGTTFLLTRNEDGSLNFRNNYMSGYFVKE